MQPAADVMAKALAEVTAHKPEIPLISNVLASAAVSYTHLDVYKRQTEMSA